MAADSPGAPSTVARAPNPLAQEPSPYPYGFCLFDVDGTLIPWGAKSPSARVIEMLTALRKKGAAVVVATGRPSAFASPTISTLDRQVDFLLTNNGATCMRVAKPKCLADPGPHEWEPAAPARALDGDKVSRCVPALQAAIPDVGMLAYFEGPPDASLRDTTVVTESMVAYLRKVMEVLPVSMIPALEELLANPITHEAPHEAHGGRALLSIWLAPGETPEELHEKAVPCCAAVDLDCQRFALDDLYEISNPSAGKETPVIHILSQLSASTGQELGREDCIAFGDGNNDISMLKWAGIGVAMGNAESAAVTTAANRVCGSVEDEGVPVVMESIMATSACSLREYRQGNIDGEAQDADETRKTSCFCFRGS